MRAMFWILAQPKITDFEGIQMNAARFVFSDYRQHTSPSVLIVQLGWSSLSWRRILARLTRLQCFGSLASLFTFSRNGLGPVLIRFSDHDGGIVRQSPYRLIAVSPFYAYTYLATLSRTKCKYIIPTRSFICFSHYNHIMYP